MYIIEPGEYGLTGSVKALTLETSPKEIMESMLFYTADVDRTEKKNYSDHVAKGRRLGGQLKWQCHLARIGTAMELLTSVEDQEEGD